MSTEPIFPRRPRPALPQQVAVPMPGIDAPDHGAYAPPDERSRLHKLAEELDRSALKEIAYRLAHLTYGELKDFAEGTKSNADDVWTWATGDEHK
jgi:hypothetical protein